MADNRHIENRLIAISQQMSD